MKQYKTYQHKPHQGFQKGHPKYFFNHSEEFKARMRVPKTPRVTIVCKEEECKKEFVVPNWKRNRAKFCSHSCKSRFHCKKYIAGKPHSEETKKKMSILRLEKGIKGEKHWHWLKDRSLLKIYQDSEAKRSPRYKRWRHEVKIRDNFKCRILNTDCNGRLEVHHILGWTKYPELRYEINNGITLCHFHHPRKREDEINLSPYFQKLVAEFK